MNRFRSKAVTSIAALASLAAAMAFASSTPASARMELAPNQISGDACIITRSVGVEAGLVLNSGANIDAPGCKVHVVDGFKLSAIFNRDSTLDAKTVCLQGEALIRNGGEVTNLDTGCKPVRDPFVGALPETGIDYTCDFYGRTTNRRRVVLTPGVYCGTFNFNPRTHVTLEPGFYVIRRGDWNMDGRSFKGAGVSIHYADRSRIQFNKGVAVDLSAPRRGAYKGLLFSEKPGLRISRIVFNDARRLNLSGLVHLPSRNLIFNTGANLVATRFGMVVNSLIVNEVDWHIAPRPDQEYRNDNSCGVVTVPAGFQGIVEADDVDPAKDGIQVDTRYRFDRDTGRHLIEALVPAKVLGRTGGRNGKIRPRTLLGCVTVKGRPYLLGINRLGENIMSTPAFVDGRVAMRTIIR